MCVIVHHALIIHDFNRLVNVVGYDPSKGTMTPNYQIVLSAVAYDFPKTGEVFIIDIHEDIFINHLNNNILCPMKMIMHAVKVNYIPKYLT